MYRAGDNDPAARLANAQQRHAALVAELERKRMVVAKLVASAVMRGEQPTAIPELPRTTGGVVDPHTIPPAAALGVAEELERATITLDARRAELDAILSELSSGRGAGTAPGLGKPPRALPTSYLFAEWFSFPLIIALGIVAVPDAIIAFAPAPGRGLAGQLVPVAIAIAVILVSLIMTMLRVRFLTHGTVAVSTTVTTTHGIGSYTNANMAQGRGWNVVRVDYTGPRQVSRVRFVADDGSTGELVVRGLAYSDGKILCLPGGGPGQTARGRVITRFHSRPRPDAVGNWQGDLSGPTKIATAIAGSLLVFIIALGLISLVRG
jgi:hypothetical protein